MGTSTGEQEGGALAPDDAFQVLGDPTRIAILQALSRAEGAVPFSALRRQVDVGDSGRFNYHLDQLLGHFVAQTDAGYRLRSAGDRVIQAVQAGAITDAPEVAPTQVERACPYCDTPSLVTYRDGQVIHYCRACPGTYGTEAVPGTGADLPDRLGVIGANEVPPAVIQGRSPAQICAADQAIMTVELMALSRRICPRCAGLIERSVRLCPDHASTETVCATCEYRYGVICVADCTNCTFANDFPAVLLCFGNEDVLAFLTGQDIDPLSDWPLRHWRETVDARDPFEGQVTCELDGAVITVTLDDRLDVVEVSTTG